MESDYDKLLTLIYSGDETNIRLAPQMGRATGIDMQAVYRQLQDCVEFFESHQRNILSIPEMIRQVKLNGINLSNFELEKLPNFIKTLAPITVDIILSHNSFYEFPEQLLQFRDLQYLNLRDNQLTKLPETLWGLNI